MKYRLRLVMMLMRAIILFGEVVVMTVRVMVVAVVVVMSFAYCFG